MGDHADDQCSSVHVRFEPYIIAFAICSHGSAKDVVAGASVIFMDLLSRDLKNRDSMSSQDIIRVLCSDRGPLIALQLFDEDNRVHIPILEGVHWRAGEAMNNRTKLFTNLTGRVMEQLGFNESQITPCKMKGRQQFRTVILELDIVVARCLLIIAFAIDH